MLCRTCEAEPERPARRTMPLRAWSPERTREARCARCGCLLGAENLTQRVREKESQLARFGLTGRTSPLTTPAVHDDDDDGRDTPKRKRA